MQISQTFASILIILLLYDRAVCNGTEFSTHNGLTYEMDAVDDTNNINRVGYSISHLNGKLMPLNGVSSAVPESVRPRSGNELESELSNYLHRTVDWDRITRAPAPQSQWTVAQLDITVKKTVAVPEPAEMPGFISVAQPTPLLPPTAVFGANNLPVDTTVTPSLLGIGATPNLSPSDNLRSIEAIDQALAAIRAQQIQLGTRLLASGDSLSSNDIAVAWALAERLESASNELKLERSRLGQQSSDVTLTSTGTIPTTSLGTESMPALTGVAPLPVHHRLQPFVNPTEPLQTRPNRRGRLD